MSLKTRIDKLSPLPNEPARLEQARSVWMLLHVVDRSPYDVVMGDKP